MPYIFITYDLAVPPGRHSEVKSIMIKNKGYSDKWSFAGIPNQQYPLPNTTLYKNTTKEQAIADLKEAVKGAGAKLETVIAAEFTSYVAEQVNPPQR